MPKLQKFKKDNKKITTKNMIMSLSIIMCLLIVVVITKSYAIYKLEKKYDLIETKIGNYSMGDVRVAVLVDGKETDTFPSYETNYKVESIECSNGVNAYWNVENWELRISDMSATSTKCTVSFNSKETNQTTPVSYTKEELIALNEEITNIAASTILDKVYPVGSIYMSTEDDTIEKVQDKFGGTWVKYSSGTTLVGDDGTNYITNDSTKGSGGSSTATLSNKNIPSLSVTGTTNSTGSGYSIGYTYSARTSTTGNAMSYRAVYDAGTSYSNNHFVGYGGYNGYAAATDKNYPGAAHTHNYNDYYANTIKGVEAHTHTFTGNYTNNSQESINIQNPYTVVYMYKRTA